MHGAPIDDDLVAEIARAAEADTRTVIRRLANLYVRGKVAARVDREIAKRLRRPRSAP